jgi:hypothetical protein
MRTLAIATFLLSWSLYACPDLTGTYTKCLPTNGHSAELSNMVVTQNVENKITSYTVAATNTHTEEREIEIYKADGKARKEVITDPDSGMSLETTSTISCKDSALKISMYMKLDGEDVGYSLVSVEKVGTQLIIDSHGFDGETEYTEKEVCE